MLLVIHTVHLQGENPTLKDKIKIIRFWAIPFFRYLTLFSYLGCHDVFDLLISSSLCNSDVRIAAAYHSALQEFTSNRHCRSASKGVITRFCWNGTAASTCHSEMFELRLKDVYMTQTWGSSRFCSVLLQHKHFEKHKAPEKPTTNRFINNLHRYWTTSYRYYASQQLTGWLHKQ